MKLTFLGTGTSQGIPVVACKCKVCTSTDTRDKRLRASVMFEINNKNIVIDCGPDFRQQMLRENIENIRAIIFTHEHRDHIAGLDDVRSFNWINKSKVDIYAESRVVDVIKDFYSYAFNNKNPYPGVPQINVNTIDENIFYIDDIKITPIRGMHYKMPLLGYKIGEIAYITDFNYMSDKEIEKIKNCKYLIINALRKEKHISHFTLSQALEYISKIKPEKAFITHIGHQMGLHAEEEANLPDNVFFAYDKLALEL